MKTNQLLLSTLFAFAAAAQTTINGSRDMVRTSPPANPPSGSLRVYADQSTGKLACLDSSGASCMPAGSGGSSAAVKSVWSPWGVPVHNGNSLGSAGLGAIAWIIPMPLDVVRSSNSVKMRLAASNASSGLVAGIYEKTGADTLTLRASTGAVLGNGAAVTVTLPWSSGAWVSGGVLTLNPASTVGELYFAIGLENNEFVLGATYTDWVQQLGLTFGRTNGGVVAGTGATIALPATLAPSTLTASSGTTIPVLAFVGW